LVAAPSGLMALAAGSDDEKTCGIVGLVTTCTWVLWRGEELGQKMDRSEFRRTNKVRPREERLRQPGVGARTGTCAIPSECNESRDGS
jgi:hypothetical protein